MGLKAMVASRGMAGSRGTSESIISRLQYIRQFYGSTGVRRIKWRWS